jgi:hypothetical protein
LRLVLFADLVYRQSLYDVAAELVLDVVMLFFPREQRPGWRGKLGCWGDEAVLKRNGHVASSRKGGWALSNTKEINGERDFFLMANLLLKEIYLMVGLQSTTAVWAILQDKILLELLNVRNQRIPQESAVKQLFFNLWAAFEHELTWASCKNFGKTCYEHAKPVGSSSLTTPKLISEQQINSMK